MAAVNILNYNQEKRMYLLSLKHHTPESIVLPNLLTVKAYTSKDLQKDDRMKEFECTSPKGNLPSACLHESHMLRIIF